MIFTACQWISSCQAPKHSATHSSSLFETACSCCTEYLGGGNIHRFDLAVLRAPHAQGCFQVKPEGREASVTVYKREKLPRAHTISAWSHRATEKQTWLWMRTMAYHARPASNGPAPTLERVISILIPTSLHVLRYGHWALTLLSSHQTLNRGIFITRRTRGAP
jgi:hypothetical protein